MASIFMAIASLGLAREQAPGYYIAGLVSADFAPKNGSAITEQEDGRGGSLAFGYSTAGPLRFEAEFGAHSFDNSRYFPPNVLYVVGYRGEDNGKSKHLSLMANLFYDFHLNSRWDFSLGAGVGVMRFSGTVPYEYAITQPHLPIFPLPLPRYSGIDRLAGQVLAGLTFHLTPRVALTGGYRLAAARNASAPGSFPINTGEFHSVEFGMRIKL